MHELSLAREVIRVVQERIGNSAATAVTLRIGKLTGIVPDCLRFAFEACAANTPLADACLMIVEIPGIVRCRACAAEFTVDDPWGICACGAINLEWLAGTDLIVESVTPRSG